MATMPDVPVSLPSLHPRRDDTFIPGSIQYPEGTSPTEMTEVEPTATPVKLSTTYDELRKKNRDEFMRQQRPYVTRPQDREKIGEPKQFVDHGQDDLSRNPSIGRSRIAQQPTDTKYGDTGFN